MKRLFQVFSGLLLGLALAALWIIRDAGPPTSDLPPAMEAAIMAGQSGAWAGTPYPNPAPLPDFALVDQDEKPVTRQTLAGAYQVLFFGYTHCPDVCPATLLHLTRAKAILGDVETEIGGVLVSVDPERDTPDRLRGYLAGFGPGIRGLTGPQKDVQAFAEAMGVGYFRVPTEDPDGPWGAYTLDHTARTFVVDPQGRLVHSFPPFLTGEQIAADLRRIFEAAGS